MRFDDGINRLAIIRVQERFIVCIPDGNTIGIVCHYDLCIIHERVCERLVLVTAVRITVNDVNYLSRLSTFEKIKAGELAHSPNLGRVQRSTKISSVELERSIEVK